MPFNDKSRFWVIFDTSTRREYYQDVHNLLALPNGQILRYNYREKYLAPTAIEAASQPDSAPDRILLIYAQWLHYQKGQDAPDAVTVAPEEMLWIGTRLASMALIPKKGEHFYFDLKLSGYPASNDDALSRILSPLIGAREVPYFKWVTLSTDTQALEELTTGNDVDNWQSVVNIIGSPPSQFAGDVFWRLEGPVYQQTGKKIEPTYDEAPSSSNGKSEVREVRTLYGLSEDKACRLEVTSHTPLTAARRTSNQPQPRLQIHNLDEAIISVVGDRSFDLRQYTSRSVELRPKRYAELEDKIATVMLKLQGQEGEWPCAPEISMYFQVQKTRWRVFGGVILLILAGVLGVIAAQTGENPTTTIVLGALAVLFTIASGLLLTGRVSVRVI